ncbi:HDIG domain-containing protein [Bacteroidales bacterium OttesenSCG-928-A17]|nr:HDIG domain-containing protein [Bacteroidales bacterium OttesenSCG-928-A17]
MKKNLIKIPVFIYFIIATLLILFLFPREGKFRYSFMEGRPWTYGLLTAPFDFPIYKTDAEIKQEEDSINRHFTPYFLLNRDVEKKQLAEFNEIASHQSGAQWSQVYKRYVERTLKEIYEKGIVSVEDYEFLVNSNYAQLRVFQNNVGVPRPVSEVFTNRSAYNYLLENLPDYLETDVLRSMDLNTFLHDNLKYDEAMSEKVKQELFQKVSPSSGMVQAGEKIIDRGEIVYPTTYNILRSLKQIYERQGGTAQRQVGLFIGVVILVSILMLCFFLYFFYLRRNIYEKRKDLTFVLFILLLFVVLTELCVNYNLFSVYIIPYAIIPLVIRTFFDSRTAQMTHLIVIFISSMMVSLAFEFIFLQLIVCLVSIYVLKDLTQRSQLIKCSFYILLTYISLYLGFLLYQDGNFSGLNWFMLLYFTINFIFVMFTYPFIYILEKIFGYISNVTLVELSDINTPLLQMLSEKSPGTFQHSLQVSMLGTAAATKVGANPQLIRTGALYHDLGKINNPGYFTENRMEGADPHASLSLEQSAKIITGHVPDGVKIAQQYDIPESIIKFIRTHHGAGKAKYFYNTFKNQFPDKEINEDAFSYSGNNPDTKETAILMMADSVEAASRSLKDYSEESVRALVNKIIDGQIADGLLSNAPLTFKNISEVKDVFVDKLVSIYHSRIAYPDLKETPDTQNTTDELHPE